MVSINDFVCCIVDGAAYNKRVQQERMEKFIMNGIRSGGYAVNRIKIVVEKGIDLICIRERKARKSKDVL